MERPPLKGALRFAPVNLGIAQAHIPRVAEGLAQVLANTHILLFKTQSVHWRISGLEFFSLHQMTEAQYKYLFEVLDTIAERIRALGHWPPGTLARVCAQAQLEEFQDGLTCHQMLQGLLEDHEYQARLCHDAVQLCETAHDIVSVDLLTSLCQFHEKAAWMLRVSAGH